MIKNIYFCGNPLLTEDNAPYVLIDDLRAIFPGILFKEFDPTEEFPLEDIVYIIDTVLGIDKVLKIYDVDCLQDSPTVSVHDADLAFNLKLLKKIGRLGDFMILGIPVVNNDGDKERVLNELESVITTLV
jgi:hypothetical protein